MLSASHARRSQRTEVLRRPSACLLFVSGRTVLKQRQAYMLRQAMLHREIACKQAASSHTNKYVLGLSSCPHQLLRASLCDDLDNCVPQG